MTSNHRETKETTNKIFRHLSRNLSIGFKRIIHQNRLLGTKVLEWRLEEEGKYRHKNKYICLYYAQLNQVALKKPETMNIGSMK